MAKNSIELGLNPDAIEGYPKPNSVTSQCQHADMKPPRNSMKLVASVLPIDVS